MLQYNNEITNLRNPARTINWPFGFQNRWFTERFSSVSAKKFSTAFTDYMLDKMLSYRRETVLQDAL